MCVLGQAVPSGHRLPAAGPERAAQSRTCAPQPVPDLFTSPGGRRFSSDPNTRDGSNWCLWPRQCATNQYLRKRDDPHRYCQEACAPVTRCGPVVVPQHHLQVWARSRTIQQLSWFRWCSVRTRNMPAGVASLASLSLSPPSNVKCAAALGSPVGPRAPRTVPGWRGPTLCCT